jgi:hypothetical protein
MHESYKHIPRCSKKLELSTLGESGKGTNTINYSTNLCRVKQLSLLRN